MEHKSRIAITIILFACAMTLGWCCFSKDPTQRKPAKDPLIEREKMKEIYQQKEKFLRQIRR